MTYPFVKAAFDYGPRKGPALAFVVHMAEGGGTVGFLSRDPNRGVSVHYVIEDTGRIVQMLDEARASGSINPAAIRTTDGPSPYGASVAAAVLGPWRKDPNSAAITLELEGFAAAGPNAKQQAALRALVDDVRSRYPAIGLLGHRDFADYKACPGALIPWDALGGHGPASQQEDHPMIPISVNSAAGPYSVGLPANAQLYDQAFRPSVKAARAAVVPGYFLTGEGWVAIGVTSGGRLQLAFVKAGDVTYQPVSAPAGQAIALAPGLYEVLP